MKLSRMCIGYGDSSLTILLGAPSEEDAVAMAASQEVRTQVKTSIEEETVQYEFIAFWNLDTKGRIGMGHADEILVLRGDPPLPDIPEERIRRL